MWYTKLIMDNFCAVVLLYVKCWNFLCDFLFLIIHVEGREQMLIKGWVFIINCFMYSYCPLWISVLPFLSWSPLSYWCTSDVLYLDLWYLWGSWSFSLARLINGMRNLHAKGSRICQKQTIQNSVEIQNSKIFVFYYCVVQWVHILMCHFLIFSSFLLICLFNCC